MIMDFLHQIAFRLGLKKLDSRIVHEWIWQQNNAMLVFALKNGSAKIRIQIMDKLPSVNLRDRSLVRQLSHIIQQDFLELAQKAAELLRPLLPQLDGKIRKNVQNALNRLEDRIRREQNRKTVYRKYKVKNNVVKHIDKNKMKQLERVRQQLKKSIRFW
jgi:hypothetical protein